MNKTKLYSIKHLIRSISLKMVFVILEIMQRKIEIMIYLKKYPGLKFTWKPN